jgi:nitrogen fixation protein FixH
MSPKTFWIGFVVLLLSISVSIQVVGLVLANSSPSFALEPDYEQRARHWDDRQVQVTLNQRLGWRVEPRYEALGTERMLLRIQLSDSSGLALSSGHLSARAFHNARANAVQQLKLVELGPGTYAAEFSVARSGIWIFELDARVGEQTFTETWRSSLARPSGQKF